MGRRGEWRGEGNGERRRGEEMQCQMQQTLRFLGEVTVHINH